MRTPKLLILPFVCALAACAGSRAEHMGAGPQYGMVSPIHKPHTLTVPSNTSFAVRLNQDVGTSVSKVGDSFTAQLVEPLRTTSGIVIVPVGARLWGRIVASEGAGHMALQFERIETRTKTIPIRATIARTNAHVIVRADTRDETQTAQTFVYAAQPQLGEATGGGPMAEDAGVIIPFDSEMLMVLQTPISNARYD